MLDAGPPVDLFDGTPMETREISARQSNSANGWSQMRVRDAMTAVDNSTAAAAAQMSAGSADEGTTDRTANIGGDPSVSRAARTKLCLAARETEYDVLMAERNALMNKEFKGGLSPRESNRLEMLEWELGEIERAEMAPTFNALEQISSLQETMASQINELLTAMNHAKEQSRGPRYIASHATRPIRGQRK